jgi:hypothetical protein
MILFLITIVRGSKVSLYRFNPNEALPQTDEL